VPGRQKLQMTPLNPVLHRIFYSCTHMTTVGIKGLNSLTLQDPVIRSGEGMRTPT